MIFSQAMASLKTIIILSFLVIFLSACATRPQYISKQEAFPAMYEQKPLSILVVPAINDSTAAEATDYYSATIAPYLSYSGYYVLPLEITTDVLNNEGIQDGRQLLDVPAEKFGTMFGADAVLFVNITEWDTNYYVIGGNVSVAVAFQMKSTKTGETLWSYKARRQISTSGNSNSGGGLIGAIIETAIKTASQDYMPIAKQVNGIAVSTMPLGSYHPFHDKDQLVKNVHPSYITETSKL